MSNKQCTHSHAYEWNQQTLETDHLDCSVSPDECPWLKCTLLVQSLGQLISLGSESFSLFCVQSLFPLNSDKLDPRDTSLLATTRLGSGRSLSQRSSTGKASILEPMVAMVWRTPRPIESTLMLRHSAGIPAHVGLDVCPVSRVSLPQWVRKPIS